VGPGAHVLKRLCPLVSCRHAREQIDDGVTLDDVLRIKALRVLYIE
jgi:hypothetical protein